MISVLSNSRLYISVYRHYTSPCSLLWYRHVNKHCGVKLVLSEEHGGCIKRSRSTWVRLGFWVWTVLLIFLGFCVLLFSTFCLSSSCVLCAQCYKKSLDCLFLISPSVFSIIFLNCSSLCPPSYHYSHCLIAFLTFEPNRLINLLFSIHLPMNILMNTYINVEFDYFLPHTVHFDVSLNYCGIWFSIAYCTFGCVPPWLCGYI
jgi:hypothetical protein